LHLKGLLFDADGVLYTRTSSIEFFVRGLLAWHGLPAQVSPDETARLEALNAEASCGRITHVQYWDEFLLSHGATDPDLRVLLRERLIARAHDIVPMAGAAETVAALKERGVRIGVVTDTMYPLEWKLGWLAQAGLDGLVDVVACSSVVGRRTSDPAIYHDALARLGLASHEAGFVGHDARELDGARAVGLVTFAVNPDRHTRADYRLKSLGELLTLVC
jgi:FMN phosphatase YigB (HAD superfamily)